MFDSTDFALGSVQDALWCLHALLRGKQPSTDSLLTVRMCELGLGCKTALQRCASGSGTSWYYIMGHIGWKHTDRQPQGRRDADAPPLLLKCW